MNRYGKEKLIDANWDGYEYVVAHKKWRSTDGDQWVGADGRYPDTDDFRSHAIRLVGGPRDGTVVS